LQNNGLLPPLYCHSGEQGNPSHGGAGDLGHEGLGELGKRERGPRGTRGAAYLGREGTADGRRRLAMAADSVRKGQRTSGLASQRCWWRRFSSGGTPCQQTHEQTGGELGVAGGARLAQTMQGGGEAREAGRAAFKGAGGRLAVVRQPRKGLAAARACPPWTPPSWRSWPGTPGPDGPHASLGRAGSGRREDGSGLRPRPSRIGFVFFEFIFNAKQFQKNNPEIV
jgi:hypothetical protein